MQATISRTSGTPARPPAMPTSRCWAQARSARQSASSRRPTRTSVPCSSSPAPACMTHRSTSRAPARPSRSSSGPSAKAATTRSPASGTKAPTSRRRPPSRSPRSNAASANTPSSRASTRKAPPAVTSPRTARARSRTSMRCISAIRPSSPPRCRMTPRPRCWRSLGRRSR